MSMHERIDLPSQPCAVSFEVFPPKTEAGLDKLRAELVDLASFQPEFVSVTYGAGGSTRDTTLGIVDWLRRTTGLDAASHLTLVGASREETDAYIDRLAEIGTRRVVALRGDAPQEDGGVAAAAFKAHPDGYQSAVELIAAIRARGDFEVIVSAYPEKHPHSPSHDADIDWLAAKADAGASRAITQFFFDNGPFYRFRDEVARRGIGIDLVPGILPIVNFPQMCRFAAQCGASVPGWLRHRFEGLSPDDDTHLMVAAAVLNEQLRDLKANGVEQFHFYTLNRAALTAAACHLLGLRKAGLVDAA